MGLWAVDQLLVFLIEGKCRVPHEMRLVGLSEDENARRLGPS